MNIKQTDYNFVDPDDYNKLSGELRDLERLDEPFDTLPPAIPTPVRWPNSTNHETDSSKTTSDT